MPGTQANSVLQYIRNLTAPDEIRKLPDHQLLTQFASRGDGAAFAHLVQRHGPMVLGLCSRILADEHDAEDAFQATFLALARKASSLHRQESIGSWLHRVAVRLALRAKHKRLRERPGLTSDVERPAADPLSEISVREAQEILHQEIARLPENHRAALVLCCLEGLARDEAARQLGWPVSAVKYHLEQARRRLRTRLSARGLTFSTGFAACLVSEQVASGAVPRVLLDSTVKAATSFAAGAAGITVVTAKVAALTEGVLKTMVLHKLRSVMVAMAICGLLLAGAGALTFQALRAGQPTAAANQQPAVESKPKFERAEDKQQNQSQTKSGPVDGHEVKLTGRVEDTTGKPVTGAQVAITTHTTSSATGQEYSASLDLLTESLGLTKADESGRFELTVQVPGGSHGKTLFALAAAPGYGLGWKLIGPSLLTTELAIRLEPETPIRGRLLGPTGQPAANTKVTLQCVGKTVGRQFVGIWPLNRAEKLPFWTGQLTTDAQGRFTIRGLGRGRTARIEIRHEPFAHQWLEISAAENEQDFQLEPAQIIEGRITYEDSGKPIPNARFSASATAKDMGRGYRTTDLQADEQGQFRLNAAAEVTVHVPAPDKEPYLGVYERVTGLDKVNLALPRGVLVRGKVVEASSGKAVAGATVGFWPREQDNSHFRSDVSTGSSFYRHTVASAADGTFQLAVFPGPGHLVVTGPTSDYIHVETSQTFLREGAPGGQRLYAHALAELDVKPDAKTHEVTVPLRRGVTVSGRLIGPGDRPLTRAMVLSILHISPDYLLPWFPEQVSDGRFELRGCDPEKKYPVFFMDPENGWGAAAVVSGKKQQSNETLTVQMESCVSATVRVVTSEGNPLAGCFARVELLLTDSADRFDASIPLFNVDHRYTDLQTGVDGRVTFPALIPGARYRIHLWREGQPLLADRHFSAKAGEKLQLPDIVVEPPQ